MSHSKTVPFREFGCIINVDHAATVPLVTQLHHDFPVELQHKVWLDATRAHPHVPHTVSLCGTHHDSVHALIRLILLERALPVGQPEDLKALAMRAVRLYKKALVAERQRLAEMHG